MANAKTVVHVGAPSVERNQSLFHQLLEDFDPLEPSILYLVASRFRRRQLQTRFLEAFPEAFEIPVVTFPDLTRTLSRSQPPPIRRIDETGKAALLEGILEDGFHLGQPDFRNGALPYVSQFIAFIKSRNISEPEMLALRYQKSRREPSPLEKELILVFARYQRLLHENGLEDGEDEQIRLYTGLLTGALDPSRVFPGLRKIVVEGLYRLTPLQAGILHHLVEAVDEAVISIGGLELPQLDPSRPEWEFLDRPGLEWVRHAPAATVEPRFSRPETRADEVLAVARQIQDLGDKEAASLEDMAVVCALPERYRSCLDEIFDDFGIPLHYASGTPTAGSAAATLFVKYLRMADADFSSETLFDFLLDSRIQIQGLSAEALRLLERVARKSGLSAGFRAWNEEFASFVKLYAEQIRESRPATATRLEESTTILLHALARLRPDTETELTLSQWRLDAASRLKPFWTVPQEETGGGLTIENRLFREFWTQLAAACVAASPDRTFSFRQFKTLVERQLGHTRSGLEVAEEGVVVATPGDLQQACFRHVFWIGLAEGEYPDSPQQHIFFDDVRSSQWGFANWEDRLVENRWLFSSLIASAKEGVFLSCPLKVGDAPVVPSSFWRDLQAGGGGFESREPCLVEHATLQFHLSPEAQANARRGIAAQWLRESGPYSIFQGFLADSGTVVRLRESLFRDSLEISPSQLENYVRCGFRYFLEKVMRVEPLDEDAQEITPLERGNLIHATLFGFVRGLDSPPDFSEETHRAWTRAQRLRMHGLLEKELARLRLEKRWRDELFWTHEEKLLSEGLLGEGGHGVLTEFVEQQWERLRTHQFEAVELRVGPVDLGVVGDLERARLVPVRLRGKVDRLDSNGDGLFVIDYKTGQDQLPRVYQGWGFQLPLYIFMLRHLRERPVAGAAFYSIRIPDEVRLREVVAADQDGDPQAGLDRLVDYYQSKAMEASRLLFDGRFPVTLLGPSNAGCRVCSFQSVCRYDASAMEPVRESGHFPIDELIVQRGRWIERPENEPAEPKAHGAKGPGNQGTKKPRGPRDQGGQWPKGPIV